jgi:hypothetical protein
MFKNRFTALKSVVAVGAIAAGAAANAALPDGASAAITGYQTDTLAAIGLVIAAGIAIYGLKKLGSKMGWL